LDGGSLSNSLRCSMGHQFVEREGIIDFSGQREGRSFLELIAPIYESIWAPVGFLLTSGRTYESVLKEVASHVSGEVLVDLGTGTGRLFDFALCDLCVGVDLSLRYLRILRERRGKVVPLRVDLERKTPLADETADGLSSTLVLHLLGDKAAAVKEISRILKKGGKFGGVILSSSKSAMARLLSKAWKVELLPPSHYISLLEYSGVTVTEFREMGAWVIVKGEKRRSLA